MRSIQTGVVNKFEGISRLVKEDEVVGGECFDNLVARQVNVVVHFRGCSLSILAHTWADETAQAGHVEHQIFLGIC